MKAVFLSAILAFVLFAGTPAFSQPGPTDNGNVRLQPFSIFGLTLGSALNRADLQAGKFDCVETPSATQPFSFMQMKDTKPKSGSDYCLTRQQLQFGVAADAMAFDAHFTQNLPEGFQDVRVEIRKDTLEITKVTADTFRSTGAVVYSALAQKYGAPDGEPITHMQNGFGATYDRYIARWTFRDGSMLRFDSGSLQVGDGGSVIAISASTARAIKDRQDTVKANERGL